MKKKFGIILIIAGALIILSSLMIHFRNTSIEKKAEESSWKVLEQLKYIMQSSGMHKVTEQEKTEEKPAPDREMPEVTIDDINYIGYLSIPEINVELPIAAELNDDTLSTSPCKYVGSVYSNNLVIAAHNFVGNFGELKTLKEGDEVILTDVNGNVFRYEVKVFEKLSSRDVDKMINSDYDFTLFTCTKGGKFRIALRCREINENKYIS